MPRNKTYKTTKKEASFAGSLKADVYSMQGEVIGKAVLPAEIFAAKVSPQLLSQAVRVYQANNRAGTHDTKTRSEVAGSTRKIYRQKGTGRARHGAITAPIFIGGGIAHGPHPIDYSLNLPQKMKQIALFGVLAEKLQNNALKIVRGMENIELKTKKMSEVLANLKLIPAKGENANILLVTPQNIKNVILSGRNIPYLTIENAKLLNTYGVISHKNVLFMEEAVPVLASHFTSKRKTKETPKNITSKPQITPSKKITSTKNISKKKTANKKIKEVR